MMSKIYSQYAQLMSDIADMEAELNGRKRILSELHKQIQDEDVAGECGTDMSAHAGKMILERLEGLAADHEHIYKDVFNSEDPSKSFIWPTKMKSFIVGILSKAKEKNEITAKDSHNGEGREYHYNVEIKAWSQEKKLIFTGIVENHVIKTGYFNWV